MAEKLCAYSEDRDDILVAYLYDDIDPAVRASFDAHLATCDRCGDELADLRGVRSQLGKWAPPEPAFATSHGLSVASPRRAANGHQPSAISHWWNEIPAWAQVAAALLFLGVAAGIANLDVRYNHDGLTVRTGWSTPAAPSSVARPVNADLAQGSRPAASDGSLPWRADLAALEQQLRREFRAAAGPGATRALAATRNGASEAETLRHVRALIDERIDASERRQQTELALRVAGVIRDVNAQRNADLVRINQNLGLFQQDMGVAVLKNQQKLDYLVRVSQTK